MKNGLLDRRFLAVSRMTEAGFPDNIWPVAFVAECNIRCPYCLNDKIVEPGKDAKYIPFAEVVRQVKEWGEEGIMVSGGESCLPINGVPMADIAIAFREEGLKVGISTNGTHPKIVDDLLHRGLLQFIAVDCKFSPKHEDNDKVSGKTEVVGGFRHMADQVMRTLNVVWRWHDDDQDAKSEIRTTLYPPLVGEDDLIDIGPLVHPRSRWMLQQYRKFKGFHTGEPVEPYGDDEAERLLAVARKHCKTSVEMRWP